MDPLCWSIKIQHCNCAVSCLNFPELRLRCLTKSILINVVHLKCLDIVQSNGRADGVCPTNFMWVWMICISSLSDFKLLGCWMQEQEAEAALALEEHGRFCSQNHRVVGLKGPL